MRRSTLAACLVVLACGSPPVAAGGPRAVRPRVLFIGNSLTAANDLPAMVAALADAAGAPFDVEAVTLPGASLGDQWLDGTARRRLASGRWDFVVLQQGPSALPESRVLLRQDAARFAELARAAGARPALYMVWPARARSGDFDAVRDSYALAARDVGGLFLPAGEAWRAAWRLDPDVALYGADDFHPTRAGSYLAALVIHAILAGRAPDGAPAPDGMPAATAALLRRAAAEIYATSARGGSAAPASSP